MRTVVFDLDGTLLGSDHAVRPAVRAALERFRALGGQVLLASSRPPRSMLSILSNLGMEDVPAVALNGAAAVEMGELTRQRPLDFETARAFVAEARARRPFIYAGWVWAVLETGPESNREANSVGFEPELRTGLDGLPPILKATANGTAEQVEDLRARARAVIGDCSLTRPKPTSLELMSPGVTKASMLDQLLPVVGTNWASTMAVGDGENDVEMIQRAAIGVAMAGASHSATAAADRVVGDHNTDTLADLLDELSEGLR